ncbi:MAG: epsJ 1 [Candidatus Eremiobacteraeota bacterium]|nr:epsJ 1 [Candidatus Eremiobacteraeota bacterium]
MPAVTVLIAAYQAELFVGRAVASALTQTLRDIEVLVVDDGSRDRTADVARAAAGGDPRLSVIRLERNRGVSAARNAGLRAARGRWVAPLDADDTFAGQRLEQLAGEADRLGADLLADDVVAVRGRVPTLGGFAAPLRGRRPNAAQFVALDIFGSDAMSIGYMKPLMRRSFLEQRGLEYPEDIYAGEDFHLYVRCLLHGAQLRFVGEGYYRANVRDESLSRSDPERVYAAFARSIAALRAEAEGLGDRAAVRALDRRSADLAAYRAYSRFSDAMHAGRVIEALRTLRGLASRAYTWRRLGMAARRRLVRGTASA